MVKKIYLDSNILLPTQLGAEKEPDHFRMATEIIEKIGSGETIVVIPTCTDGSDEWCYA